MFLETTQPGKTVADPFSLESLISWLEKQPAGKTYAWYSVYGCLVCQFYQAHGIAAPWGNLATGYDRPFDRGLGKTDAHLRYHAVGHPKPWTFGAALSRARAAQARS